MCVRFQHKGLLTGLLLGINCFWEAESLGETLGEAKDRKSRIRGVQFGQRFAEGYFVQHAPRVFIPFNRTGLQ
jgi:hypothetical protein